MMLIRPGFLSETWQVQDNGMFAASFIGVGFLVVVLETLRRISREYDEWILRGWQNRVAMIAVEKGRLAEPQVVTMRASPLQQLLRAVIHAIIVGVAYIVMLLVMSFNGYIIICVILGAGLGKFISDWMTRRIAIEGKQEGAAVVHVEDQTVCCG